MPVLNIAEVQDWVCLENYSTFLTTNQEVTPTQALSSKNFQRFEEVTFDRQTSSIWIKFQLGSSQKGDSLSVNTKFYDEVKLFKIINDSIPVLIRSTGYLSQYQDKDVRYYNSCISLYHPEKTQQKYLINLVSHTKNSKRLSSYFTSNCAKLYSQQGFISEYKIPKPLLFFFFGAILMMSCYNLGTAITTQYKEYILFSIYNFCFVWMALSLSNLPIELGWIKPFDFERNLRFLPALVGIPVYILFSNHFLEIQKTNTKIHHFLKYLLWVFPLLILLLFFSEFSIVYFTFSFLMIPLFCCVLYASWVKMKERKHTRYFLFGNILLISVGVVQLISMYGGISVANATITSMIALMLEIIFFSFAVSIKQKVTRRAYHIMKTRNQLQKDQIKYEQILKMELELEIEKKSRALSSTSIQWINLTEQLLNLKQKVKEELKDQNPLLYKEIKKRIEKIEDFEDHWNSFKIHFENVHHGFFETIEYYFPMLSQNDLKICAFMKMKLSNKEIAQILNITKKAVEQSKRRMRKKIGLTTDEGLLEFVENSITLATKKASVRVGT